MNKNTEKDKRLEEVLANIEKQFGKGSIMKLGEHEHQKIEVSPTGSISLDLALGVGGYPKGRIIEIYGPESSGKTTIALHAIAEVQKQGGRAAFIDAEHALDPVYASNLGVDIDELLLSQPDTGEQALEICDALVRSEALSIIVIDSVAALVPQAEIDGEIGDNQIGLQARLMSRALRKLSGSISKTQTIVIFINQLREKVGVIFGNPETTPGGKALKYYSSVRLDIRRGEQIKNNSEILGNKTNIKVVKNKVAPPFKTTTIEIIYGQGISRLGEIIDLSAEHGIIEKSGSWYAYQGNKIGQGKENVKQYLNQNKPLQIEIENKLRKKIGIDKKGGTMRLGAYPCLLKEESLAYKLYGKKEISERHRHRYEYNNDYREILEKSGLKVSGTSPDGLLVEIVEIDQKEHPYFIAGQFHPELKSRPNKPAPLFVGLVDAAKKHRG